MKKQLPGSRVVNGLGAMINVAAMLFAVLFLEKTLYLEPCPLCIIDRLIVAGMALIFLLAVLHNPARATPWLGFLCLKTLKSQLRGNSFFVKAPPRAGRPG